MVRWKRLKRWPVNRAFAWTQIGRYGKWRLYCIDTLVPLESASIHFWDLKSKTIWQAVETWVFYRCCIKLTVVDAENLGMIHLFGGQCDWRRPWWCWNPDYTRFYHIVDHFPYSERCTVGPQFYESAAIRFDGEGNCSVQGWKGPRQKRLYTPSWRHWCKGGNSSQTEAVWRMKSVYGVMLKFWPNNVSFLVL